MWKLGYLWTCILQLHQLEELLGMNIVKMGLNTLQTASLTGGLGMNTCKWTVHHPRARCEHFTNHRRFFGTDPEARHLEKMQIEQNLKVGLISVQTSYFCPQWLAWHSVWSHVECDGWTASLCAGASWNVLRLGRVSGGTGTYYFSVGTLKVYNPTICIKSLLTLDNIENLYMYMHITNTTHVHTHQ